MILFYLTLLFLMEGGESAVCACGCDLAAGFANGGEEDAKGEFDCVGEILAGKEIGLEAVESLGSGS